MTERKKTWTDGIEAEASRLRAEASRLRAEASRLRAEASRRRLLQEMSQLLAADNINDALGVVLKEAGKIKKPDQFHLGGGQWIDGINLETLKFSVGRTRPAMMVTMGVFDCTNGEFRFCESLKPVTRLVEGIRVTGSELERQIDQGHETFFAGGSREQQQMLLSATLAAIFRIREAEERMPKI